MIIIGVDEAGRGALAGPVCAAAVVMDDCLLNCKWIKDSKMLSSEKRDEMFKYITANCIYGVGFSSVAEIEKFNILQATMQAMSRAIAKLNKNFLDCCVLVDGNQVPKSFPLNSRAIVKGDQLVPAIAAASIIAKVTRDSIMKSLHFLHPSYDWQHNKGYPTVNHLKMINSHGVNKNHRKTFAPIAKIMNHNKSHQISLGIELNHVI